jgi:endo-1,4-beta-xylanase
MRGRAAFAPGLALTFAVVGACGGGATSGSLAGPSTSPSAQPALEAEALKGLAGSRLVGAAVQASLLADPSYASVAARHFSWITPENEMKWGQIERTRGAPNYGPADAIVSFAQDRAIRIRGHALVWHSDTPAWFEGLSNSDASLALSSHIRATAGRYRGQLAAWDVVNEAIADGASGLRDTVYLRKLGAGYIADAFRLAREADPTALLFYNDYGAEGLGRKSDDVYSLVSGLLRDGVPIDGVGLQMHLDATARPSTADIAANMRRLAALGLLVNISEMDVRVARVAGSTAQKLDEQGRVYRDVVTACVAEPKCHAITFWGFTDRHSWIDQTFGADDPLPFDENYRVKPAYTGVADALRGR